MNFKESLDKPIFKTICKIADQLNFPTYVVGGWVRDLLLKRKRKIEDIDFVCIGSGIILAEKITQELGANAYLKVFKYFGNFSVPYGTFLGHMGPYGPVWARMRAKPSRKNTFCF